VPKESKVIKGRFENYSVVCKSHDEQCWRGSVQKWTDETTPIGMDVHIELRLVSGSWISAVSTGRGLNCKLEFSFAKATDKAALEAALSCVKTKIVKEV
jgi:hypothetical protein